MSVFYCMCCHRTLPHFVCVPLGRGPCVVFEDTPTLKIHPGFPGAPNTTLALCCVLAEGYSSEKDPCHRIHNKCCEAGLGQLTLLLSALPLYTFSPSLIIWVYCLCSRVGDVRTKREKLMLKPLAVLRKLYRFRASSALNL